MKHQLFLFVFIFIISCNKKESIADISNFVVFGDTISTDNAISESDLLKKYQNLKEGDTINVKVKSKILDVCSKKGCWMNLDLGNNQTSFVKFKDYAFFVPLNAAGSEVIVEGKAFLKVESVEALKHYAYDAGATQEVIDTITQPEKTFAFISHGVLIKK